MLLPFTEWRPKPRNSVVSNFSSGVLAYVPRFIHKSSGLAPTQARIPSGPEAFQAGPFARTRSPHLPAVAATHTTRELGVTGCFLDSHRGEGVAQLVSLSQQFRVAVSKGSDPVIAALTSPPPPSDIPLPPLPPLCRLGPRGAIYLCVFPSLIQPALPQLFCQQGLSQIKPVLPQPRHNLTHGKSDMFFSSVHFSYIILLPSTHQKRIPRQESRIILLLCFFIPSKNRIIRLLWYFSYLLKTYLFGDPEAQFYLAHTFGRQHTVLPRTFSEICLVLWPLLGRRDLLRCSNLQI